MGTRLAVRAVAVVVGRLRLRVRLVRLRLEVIHVARVLCGRKNQNEK